MIYIATVDIRKLSQYWTGKEVKKEVMAQSEVSYWHFPRATEEFNEESLSTVEVKSEIKKI